MSVESYTLTQYTITCDICGKTEVCPDGNAENVHSKQQAIKWANMHKKNKTILRDECFSRQNYNKEENQSYMDKVLEEQSKHLRNASNIIKPYYNKNPKDIPKSVLEQHTKEIQKAAKYANKCVDMLKLDKNRSKQ